LIIFRSEQNVVSTNPWKHSSSRSIFLLPRSFVDM
jgi:hypothetical protein